MWEWLVSPIDPSGLHDVSSAISWHARAMVLGWGIVAPLSVLVARFFKIMPGQNWPVVLDSKVWWRSHWMGQSFVFCLTILGLYLVLPSDFSKMSFHGWLGYSVVTALVLQVLLGVFRGSKGGPNEVGRDSPRGHHYDMTRWRRAFEALHKTLGYSVLALAAIAITFGLWKANAPNWMWVCLGLWWCVLLIGFFAMQRRGMAIDTYQAIWGSDPEHPGNQMPHPGWGVRRPGDDWKEEDYVRDDRGNRLRSH